MIQLASVTIGVLLGISTAAALLIAVLRAARGLRQRRRAERAAAPRRALLALAAGGEGAPELEAVAGMPDDAWRAVEPTALDLLAKVRGEARESLAEVFARRGVVARALRDLRDGRPITQARAAELLGRLGRREAVPALCSLVADPRAHSRRGTVTGVRAELRVVAIRALGRLGDPSAVAPLVSSLGGADPAPSQLVAHALIQLGPDAAPALMTALNAPQPLVRMTVLDALGRLGAAGAEQRVAALLHDDPSPSVRETAATALGRLGTGSALRPLLDAANSDESLALRASAVRALGQLGAREAIAPLTALIASPHYRIAHEAAGALRRLGSAGHATLRELAGRSGTDGAGAHAREALGMAELTGQR
ncbi:HEAT repeat domain-containing protein [Micromonospora sp. NPDC049679]|uniref:HEAT repeat domain-containing protein n=1 Tax=Micromonospora sp. NPDC049679 TaxID=3155920 RepID=UPI0033CF43D4